MIVSQVEKDMREDFGRPYGTVNQIARHFGRSKAWAAKLVEGLPCIPAVERGNRYHTKDIAEKLMKEVKYI